MPLDIPMPWLRGPDTLGALSSGASAGAAAARIEQEGRSDAAHLAQDAIQHNHHNQLEAARLQQEAQQSQMELQAKKEATQQNQLRENQKLLIDNAYRQSMLGVAKGRLEESQKVANEKYQRAAMQFQRERGFAKAVSSGVSPMEAYQQFPVSPSLLGAAERSRVKEDKGKTPVLREGKYPLIEYDPATGKATQVYTPPKPEGPSSSDKEDLKDLRHERDSLTKKYDDPIREKFSPTSPAEKKAYADRLSEIDKRIQELKHGGPPLKPPTGKNKVDRAHELSAAHPDWTKEQIVKAVNDEIK